MAYLWQSVLVLFVLEILTFGFFISKIGFLMVFGLWLLSAITGGYLVRHGGIATLMSVMSPSQSPQKPVVGGIFVLIAGLLFIFPGFLSDFMALVVLMPFIQPWLKSMTSSFVAPQTQNNPPSPRPHDEGIIEGDFVVVKDNNTSLPHDDAAKH